MTDSTFRRCFVLAASLFLGAFSLRAQPSVGEVAPDFQLPAATAEAILKDEVKLSDVVEKGYVLLAFYPADWSGGCTTEMCTIRENFDDFSTLGVTVLGISGDYIHSHHAWAKQYHLQFTLLSDHQHQVARAYGSYNSSTGYNLRTVFLVDRTRHVVYRDLAYKAGSEESFARLMQAVRALK